MSNLQIGSWSALNRRQERTLRLEAAMKRLLFGIAFGLAIHSLVMAQHVDTEAVREYAFSDGGSVRLRLSSGEYVVRAGQRDRIIVHWSVKDPEEQKDMSKIEVSA